MSLSHMRFLNDVRTFIQDLGREGGLIGPSIYDTAQVLRFAPVTENTQPTREWLIRQQHADGGWNTSAVPFSRTSATLASLLALYPYYGIDSPSIQAGLKFLHGQKQVIDGPVPDDLLVAAELMIPHLADEAIAQGLDVPQGYRSLREVGAQRRRKIAHLPMMSGTTIAHAWEAWGETPAVELLDGIGSVSHSPAGTAAWLYATRDRRDLHAERLAAQEYLRQVSFMSHKVITNQCIPGVMPPVWPIDRFEQIFALYAFVTADLLRHPQLQQELSAQIDQIEQVMRPDGIGYSDWFTSDGDDTAAACAVLAAAGRFPHLGALAHYAVGDHYCAWMHEMQSATSVTSHAIHALRLAGADFAAAAHYLLSYQQPDGYWNGDKWNRSWCYTTGQAVCALGAAMPPEAIRRVVSCIIAEQHSDGGWGVDDSYGEETAYITLALRTLDREGVLPEDAYPALFRGEEWLLDPDRQPDNGRLTIWLAKQPFYPKRIASSFELAAMTIAQESLRSVEE